MRKDPSIRTQPVAAYAVWTRHAWWCRLWWWLARRDPVVPALLVLPLLIFGPQATGRSIFSAHDIQYYFYPYHALSARLVAQGQAPLWNPDAFSGLPLLGDGQTAVFYPPNWLFFLPGLPPAVALNYAILTQFCIAGLGLYGYARTLGLWRLPAAVAAVAYQCGGFMTARVVHLSILGGAALLPALFLCVERALRPGPGKARWSATAAVVVALQVAAGHPQLPIYTALALGLYVLVRAVEQGVLSGRPHPLVLLPLQLAGIYALGWSLAAIQLVPWIELARLSPRAAGASFEFVFARSMQGSDWLLFLFPYLYGGLREGLYAERVPQIGIAAKIWEHSAYVGILPLALAVVALSDLVRPRAVFGRGGEGASLRSAQDRSAQDRGGYPTGCHTQRVPGVVPRVGPAQDEGATEDGHGRLRRRWFSLCALALVLALGGVLAAGRSTPLAGPLYATPVIGKLRDVERAIVLVAFALTVLAAFGLQRLIEPGSGHPRDLRRPALLLLAAALWVVPTGVVLLAHRPALLGVAGIETQDLQLLQLGRANAWVPLLLAGASAALLAWWSGRPASRHTQVLALALVAIDLAGYAATFHPGADPWLYRREPAVVSFLRQDPALFRKATYLTNNALDERAAREVLAVSWGMAYGIPDINGFNSLQPRRYTDFLFSPDRADVSYGHLTDEALLTADSPILSALGVKYLLVPIAVQPGLGETFRPVYENDAVRVYENERVYPRAYFATTVRAEADGRAVLRAVTATGFDGRHQALVEPGAGGALPGSLGAAATAAPGAGGDEDAVAFARYTPNALSLTTVTATSRFLVLGEMDFPGWRAYLDGAETPIYRTNYLFRGVVVPPGEHTVSFVYRPTSLVVGAAVSALALLVAAGLVVGVAPRPGRRSDRPRPLEQR